MMIEKHISALLYRYQCVMVPGFGAFVTETISARLNENSGAFTPPKKTILFNSLLQQNDGLLANHIALQEKISFGQALNLIHEQVAKWKMALKRGETIYLKNIGELSPNSDQKIIFEPIGSTNYLTSSFGLAAVQTSIITHTEEQTKVVELPKTNRRPNLQWLRYASIVVAAIGIYGSYATYQEYEVYQEQKLAVEKDVQTQIEQKLQQATFVIEAPKAVKKKIAEVVTESVSTNTKPFHIVAGAFKTEAKAQILTDELKAKGYVNAKYLSKSKHHMRHVVYNSYTTQEEARKDLRLIHEKVNQDAWIYVEK